MIDKKLIPYGGLKKEPFSGTHHGMRYFFRGDDGKSRRMLDSVKYRQGQGKKMLCPCFCG